MLREINEILWWLDACTYARKTNHVRAHENVHRYTDKKGMGGGGGGGKNKKKKVTFNKNL